MAADFTEPKSAAPPGSSFSTLRRGVIAPVLRNAPAPFLWRKAVFTGRKRSARASCAGELRERADRVIETSALRVHECVTTIPPLPSAHTKRAGVATRLARWRSGGGQFPRLQIGDADRAGYSSMDLRFIPNPSFRGVAAADGAGSKGGGGMGAGPTRAQAILQPFEACCAPLSPMYDPRGQRLPVAGDGRHRRPASSR